MRPNDSSNPLSDAFRREALNNVASHMSSLKNQRELKNNPTDSFERARDDKSLPRMDHAVTGRSDVTPEEAEKAAAAARASGQLDDTDPEAIKRRREEAERLARDGVPPELLQAAKHIVEGQLHPVKGPRASLKDMKNPEETAQMHVEPEAFQDSMDIHDRAHPPAVIEDGPGE
jgi:hypothetical protein